jgi:hypothetical protein
MLHIRFGPRIGGTLRNIVNSVKPIYLIGCIDQKVQRLLRTNENLWPTQCNVCCKR